jgi:hypothetical protein
MSERYLEELERALRRHRVMAWRRRRFLAEARDHIACDPSAVTSFGAPDRLAQEVARAEQPRRARFLTLFLVATVVAFVVPLYGIPENTLPAAPAEGLPDHVTWKLDWAIVLYGAALVLASMACVVAWIRPRFAMWPAWLAVGSLVGSLGLATAAAVEWPVGGGIAIASVVPVAAALACLAAFATARLTSAPLRS